MYVLQILLTHAAAVKIRATTYSSWVMAQANPIRPLNGTSEVWGGKSRVKNGTAFSTLSRRLLNQLKGYLNFS